MKSEYVPWKRWRISARPSRGHSLAQVASVGAITVALGSDGKLLAVGVFVGSSDGLVLRARAAPASAAFRERRFAGRYGGQMTESWKKAVDKMRRERALELYGKEDL